MKCKNKTNATRVIAYSDGSSVIFDFYDGKWHKRGERIVEEDID